MSAIAVRARGFLAADGVRAFNVSAAGLNISAPVLWAPGAVAGSYLYVQVYIPRPFYIGSANIGGLLSYASTATGAAQVVGRLTYHSATGTAFGTYVVLRTVSPIAAIYTGATLTAWIAQNVDLAAVGVGTTTNALPAPGAYATISFVVAASGAGVGTSGGAGGGASGAGGGTTGTTGQTTSPGAPPTMSISSLPAVKAGSPATAVLAVQNQTASTQTYQVTGTLQLGGQVIGNWIPASVTVPASGRASVALTTNGGINPVNAGTSITCVFAAGGATATGYLAVLGTAGQNTGGTSGTGTGVPPVGAGTGTGTGTGSGTGAGTGTGSGTGSGTGGGGVTTTTTTAKIPAWVYAVGAGGLGLVGVVALIPRRGRSAS